NAARRSAAGRYDKLIEAAGLNGLLHRPVVRPDGVPTFNQYTVRVPAADRDALVAHLKTEQVGCDIYYPLCLHQQECLKGLGYETGDFPAAERAANEVMSLPMFPDLTEAQQRRAVEAIGTYGRQRVRRAA
ncbi:MAG: DegT/DnrJ/EryC1/StrS family aminotransferase, partial [Fimbriiglobus sp.]